MPDTLETLQHKVHICREASSYLLLVRNLCKLDTNSAVCEIKRQIDCIESQIQQQLLAIPIVMPDVDPRCLGTRFGPPNANSVASGCACGGAVPPAQPTAAEPAGE